MHYDLIYSITGGGSKKDDAEKKKEDVLNIFSVASGHLYERFLRWVAFTSQSLTHSRAYDTVQDFTRYIHLSPDPQTDPSVRFRIMMLSVLRHTKTPVKFWFLKNYLSPSFKVLLSLRDSVRVFSVFLRVQNNFFFFRDSFIRSKEKICGFFPPL